MSDKEFKVGSWENKTEREEWWMILDSILRERMENEMQRNREREIENSKNLDFLQEVCKQIQKKNEI